MPKAPYPRSPRARVEPGERAAPRVHEFLVRRIIPQRLQIDVGVQLDVVAKALREGCAESIDREVALSEQR